MKKGRPFLCVRGTGAWHCASPCGARQEERLVTKRKTWVRLAGVTLLAFLSTMALLVDFSPTEINRLDVYGPVGYLYKWINIVHLTAESHAVVFPLVWGALAWLYNRLLLKGKARWGEHALCAVMAGLTLLSRGVSVPGMLPWRECRDIGGTIATLWADSGQMMKSAMFLAGMWAAFLAALRALERLPGRFETDARLSLKHPFLTPLAVMTLVWLPQLVIRYPGVLHFDTGWTINEYAGIFPYTTHHPPFFIIVSGWLFMLGKQLAGAKVGMLLLTLVLMISMLCVLAHAVSTAQRLRISKKAGYLLIAVFCLQPMYVSYGTYVAKDSYYTVALLLVMTQMLVLCVERPRGMPAWKDLLLLAVGVIFAVFTRKNGIYVVLVSLLCLAAALLLAHRRRAGLAVAGCLAAALVVTQSVTGALISAYGFTPGSQREAFSLPFQQTARVALLHREELTQDEVAVIQGVLDIDVITSEYDAELADPVKETFRDDAEPGAMSAYLGLWLEQLARYPVEYIDAAVNLSGELYDPLMQKTEFYEKSSFHNLDGDEVALWHKESPFYMLNETLMELHYMLASLLSINLGQCAFLSLMAGYLLARSRKLRIRAVAALPVYLTMGVVLLSPITETRYGLPVCLGAPMLLAWLVLPKHSGEAAEKTPCPIDK